MIKETKSNAQQTTITSEAQEQLENSNKEKIEKLEKILGEKIEQAEILENDLKGKNGELLEKLLKLQNEISDLKEARKLSPLAEAVLKFEDLQEIGCDTNVKKLEEEIASLNLQIDQYQKEQADLQNQISQLQNVSREDTHHNRRTSMVTELTQAT